jgi:hypothetical protein
MQFFMFLNLDYLQLQRENANREKMQAIFLSSWNQKKI